MIVKFGNLKQPHHTNNPDKPEAREKVAEMMRKLQEAGFQLHENVSNGVPDGKYYHIFSLPHQIEFGCVADDAVAIMEPYSEYMQPLQVVGVMDDSGKNN